MATSIECSHVTGKDDICADCFGGFMAKREAEDLLRANADALRHAAAIFEAANNSGSREPNPRRDSAMKCPHVKDGLCSRCFSMFERLERQEQDEADRDALERARSVLERLGYRSLAQQVLNALPR